MGYNEIMRHENWDITTTSAKCVIYIKAMKNKIPENKNKEKVLQNPKPQSKIIIIKLQKYLDKDSIITLKLFTNPLPPSIIWKDLS